jgi:hypothetical protein
MKERLVPGRRNVSSGSCRACVALLDVRASLTPATDFPRDARLNVSMTIP